MKRMPSLCCLLFTFGLLMLEHGTIFAADVRVGLISYWPLDMDNGGTTPDMGSGGNSLTEVNGATVVSGQVSNAFSLNGTSQYLSITHGFDYGTSGLPIYNSPGGYTVMMWVKGAAQTAKYIFTEGSTASTNPLFLIQTGNAANTNSHLDILIRTTGGTTLINHGASTSVVFDDTWHHIAWVDNHGAFKLYVDGVLDGTTYNYAYALGGLTMNTTTIGQLVRSSGPAANAYFNGQIDEVVTWERPLSQIGRAS